jgi:AraC-like DNA-binding protein
MTVERHLVLQELTLLPSAEWQPQFENWLVLRVGEGDGYWMTANDAVELRYGSMLVSSRNHKGLIRASSLGPLKLDYFFIQPTLLSGVLAMMDGQQLSLSSAQSVGQPLIWSANDPLALRFSEVAANTNRSGLPLRIRLLEIWADAVAGMLRPLAESRGTLDLRERFRQLLGQMSQAELSSCSLGDLAGQLRCSERHLSRLFREEFGTPFRTQQTELRLLRARQMLADSNTKIIKVAYESGYRHLGLFNTMFKKRFGMTPTQWRWKAARESGKSAVAFLCSWSLALSCLATESEINSPVHAPIVSAVNRCEVAGNTLFTKDALDGIFTGAEGMNVRFNTISRALTELPTAHCECGHAPVTASLPQQQLANEPSLVCEKAIRPVLMATLYFHALSPNRNSFAADSSWRGFKIATCN